MPDTKMLAEWFWVDRWVGSSAFGLNIAARGLYREMLSQAWRRGAELPNDHDQIRRICGVTRAEWKRTWPFVQRFWRVDGETLVNDTQREVYAEAQGRRAAFSARGRKGATARYEAATSTPQAAGKQDVSTAQAVLKHQPPISDHQSPRDPDPPSSTESPHDGVLSHKRLTARERDFDTFWAAYPRKIGKDKARAEWKKRRDLPSVDVLLDALAIQRQAAQWQQEGGRFIPHPATWLHQGRWQDEPAQIGAAVSDRTRQNMAAMDAWLGESA